MRTVRDLIARNEHFYPEKDFLVLGQDRQAYGQRAVRVRQLASALYRLGVRAQDRVGILSTNRIEYYEVTGACEWAGFIGSLYNFRCAPPELLHFIGDSSPAVVAFEHRFMAAVETVRKHFPAIRWICLDASPPEWAMDYSALLDSGDSGGPPIAPSESSLAWLFYTSGTTGRPKGVPVDHGGILALARQRGRDLGRDARLLQVSPAFHTAGMNGPTAATWLAGRVVLMRNFDATEFLSVVEREAITHTFMVPMMMQAILSHPDFSREKVRSLRSVMAASTAIPVPLLQQAIEAFGRLFYVAYGSTECGVIASLGADEINPFGSAQDILRIASVGHFEPEVEATVLDDEGRPCAPGVVGEVCVRSPVFRGYWNNMPATLEATRSGYLHTGDLGRLDHEGYLFLVDRKKDMIISGGENIYCREVEDAIHRHAAVASVAVVGVPDDRWGEAVKAWVVLRAGFALAKEELTAHCKREIAGYKCPRHLEIIPELPMLASGKIDKQALRARR